MATDSPSGAASTVVLQTKQEQTNPISEYSHALSSPKQLSHSDLTASLSSRLPFKKQWAILSVAYPNHDKAQQFLHRGYLAGLYPVLVVSPSVHEPDILLGSPPCCRCWGIKKKKKKSEYSSVLGWTEKEPFTYSILFYCHTPCLRESTLQILKPWPAKESDKLFSVVEF